MIYTIKWSEVTKSGTTNGRDWRMTSMLLVDGTGTETDKVTTFDKVETGGTIEGEIVQNGQYLNFKKKLEAPEFIKNSRGSNFKAQQIEKAVEKKNEAIAHFQDEKEKSIALAGAQRDAVLIVVQKMATSPDLLDKVAWDEQLIKEEIIKWRNWFLSENFRLPPPF